MARFNLAKGFIVNNDVFGHSINLNLSKSGKTHKTLLTGIASTILKIWVITFFYIRMLKLFTTGEGDQNAT